MFPSRNELIQERKQNYIKYFSLSDIFYIRTFLSIVSSSSFILYFFSVFTYALSWNEYRWNPLSANAIQSPTLIYIKRCRIIMHAFITVNWLLSFFLFTFLWIFPHWMPYVFAISFCYYSFNLFHLKINGHNVLSSTLFHNIQLNTWMYNSLVPHLFFSFTPFLSIVKWKWKILQSQWRGILGHEKKLSHNVSNVK